MNKKSIIRSFVVFLIFLSSSLSAKSKDIDSTIAEISESIVSSVEQNTNIAILDFSAENDALGVYIRDQLSEKIMETGEIILVTRNHTDLVMKELEYQLSGYVSDETALSICRQLGAKALVFGQIEEFDNNYLLQIKMIDVETGAYILFKNYNVAHSQKIERLLGHAASYYKTSIGLNVEGNMYSVNGFALSGGVFFDYALSKKISLGIKTHFSYDILSKELSIFTVEPLGFCRFYIVSPSGEPSSGVFAELQAGVALINVNSKLNPQFVAGCEVGYRFGLSSFFIEPFVRGGIPFVMGAGILVGIRF